MSPAVALRPPLQSLNLGNQSVDVALDAVHSQQRMLRLRQMVEQSNVRNAMALEEAEALSAQAEALAAAAAFERGVEAGRHGDTS